MEVSLSELEQFAAQFVADLPKAISGQAHIVGLKGDLGAGKTTFVQAVARSLGVMGKVTSPTFVIASRYETTHPVFTNLIHVDAYRLSGEEKDTFGFAGYLANPHNLILVEWPENLPQEVRLPEGTANLAFEVRAEQVRDITYV